MSLQVTPTIIAEMKDLLSSGDESLEKRRATFKKIKGRDTTLDDDKLTIALAALSDDDDEEFCDNVIKVEKGEYQIAA